MSFCKHVLRVLPSPLRVFSTTASRQARQPRGRLNPKRFGLALQPLSDAYFDDLEVDPEGPHNTWTAPLDEKGFGLDKGLRESRARDAARLELDMLEAALDGGLHKLPGLKKGRMVPPLEGWIPAGRRATEDGRMETQWKPPTQSLSKERDGQLVEAASWEGYDRLGTSTVYVGEIPADMTKDDMRKQFGRFGEITDVQFPTDLSGPKHWAGYARLSFRSPSVAETVAAMKHNDLVVRSCMFGREEKPIYHGKPGSVLSVNNLPHVSTQTELRQLFSRFGPIEFVDIPLNRKGENRLRAAKVNFFNDDTALAATKHAIHTPITLGRRELELSVCRTYPIYNPPSRALYIGNIHMEATEDALRLLFRGIEAVTHCTLVFPDKLGSPGLLGGKAFLTFESVTAAKKVLDMHHLLPFEFKGHQLQINFCNPFADAHPRATWKSGLYLTGISTNCKLLDLKHAFKKYKTNINNMAIKLDDSARCIGTGFINMKNPESAEQVIADHVRDPLMLDGRAITVTLAEAKEIYEPSRDLIVLNMKRNMSELGLRQHFEEFAKHIERVHGASKPYSFQEKPG
ncbi:hypothetical protein BXZ70DRAFT_115998 [Cristinia sonorae]|uniref:RRM domain-containing protein n=1 Tax=Cristinia sonorae TaxID=1940300 RepID=A0A8K0UPN2_9AGAR|nr:hypothetical protein BXZ70DRAFT_115998 [Cristinia sonorae]